jgi:hypothetical protein
MSEFNAKIRKFAPSSNKVTDMLTEVRNDYSVVDESRQLIRQEIRNKEMHSPLLMDITFKDIPHMGRESFSYLISGSREPIIEIYGNLTPLLNELENV